MWRRMPGWQCSLLISWVANLHGGCAVQKPRQAVAGAQGKRDDTESESQTYRIEHHGLFFLRSNPSPSAAPPLNRGSQKQLERRLLSCFLLQPGPPFRDWAFGLI